MNAMRKWLGLCIALLGGLAPQAAESGEPGRFVIRSSRAAIGEVCKTHGLRLIRELGRPDLFLVAGPEGIPADELQPSVANDLRVGGFERDRKAGLPRSSFPGFGRSNVTILAGSQGVAAQASSSAPWLALAGQPAALLIGVDRVHAAKLLGRGVVVALIDTSVDASHPVLRGAIVPGHDFIADEAGANAAGLDQSTVVILQKKPEKPALNQSTVTILSRNPTPPPVSKLSAASATGGDWSGHGTMVAGLIRAVAPEARIMPLRAFAADGSASLSAVCEPSTLPRMREPGCST